MKKVTILSLLLSLVTLNSFARTALKPEVKKKVIKVLDLNDELHMAFFEYDAKNVEAKGQELKKAMMTIKEPSLVKLFKKSLTSLDSMTAKAKREDNDEAYHEVSMALVYVVNTYDVGEGYNEYTCPMVKKKWVQNSKKRARTHNPYAPWMPHCGGQVTDY